MSTARTIGLGAAALIGTIIIGGVALPSRFQVSRTATIDAPVELVFDQIVDVKRSEAWSPWKAQDPTMKMTYDTITAGEGAKYTWTSEAMGAGSYAITRVEPNRKVVVHLEFSDEGGPGADASFLLESKDAQTEVTWTMTGEEQTPLLGPYIALMMGRMVGPSFEQGLSMLNDVAKQAQQDAEKRAKEAAAVKAAADAARAAAAAKAAAAAPALVTSPGATMGSTLGAPANPAPPPAAPAPTP